MRAVDIYLRLASYQREKHIIDRTDRHARRTVALTASIPRLLDRCASNAVSFSTELLVEEHISICTPCPYPLWAQLAVVWSVVTRRRPPAPRRGRGWWEGGREEKYSFILLEGQKNIVLQY